MSPQELEEQTQTALANIFGADSTILTRFVLVAEIIDTDGERALWACTSDGLTKWDSMGMLEFALNRERTDDDDD